MRPDALDRFDLEKLQNSTVIDKCSLLLEINYFRTCNCFIQLDMFILWMRV